MASSQSTPSGLALPGMVQLDLGIVDLTGADVREWLQGQVTQDLRTLTPGGSIRACLCKPTGQLLAHLDIWDMGESLRLLIHRSEIHALWTRLEEAVIIEDVEATVVPRTIVHYFDDHELPIGTLMTKLRESMEPENAASMRERNRTGKTGIDQVTDDALRSGEDLRRWREKSRLEFAAKTSELTPHMREAAETVSEWEHPAAMERVRKEFDILTLAAGEPIPGVDTNEKTLPPELGPAFEAATTSYRKGCYTGQEVLMRIHSRGHTNRTWRGLLASEPLRAGDRVLADGAEVGKITRAGVHPTLGPIAAAFLRREAEGKGLTVETPYGITAVEARDLPLLSE